MLSYVRPIESKFKPFIKEALLAEIVLGNICSVGEAIGYMKSTFYYVRMGKNPSYYGIKSIRNKDESLYKLVDKVL